MWLPLVALLFIGLAAGEAVSPLPPVGAICVACRFEAAAVIGVYTAPEWNQLLAGRVLTDTPPSGKTADQDDREASGSVMIPQTAERVWGVLTDFENWPAFMPYIRKTRVRRKEGPRRWVEQHFRIVFKSLQHTTRYELAPAEGRLDWSLDPAFPHDIVASRGHWQLIRVRDGNATLVRYESHMNPGRPLPMFVQRMLTRHSLQRMLRALRSEVATRYGSPVPHAIPSKRPASSGKAASDASGREAVGSDR